MTFHFKNAKRERKPKRIFEPDVRSTITRNPPTKHSQSETISEEFESLGTPPCTPTAVKRPRSRTPSRSQSMQPPQPSTPTPTPTRQPASLPSVRKKAPNKFDYDALPEYPTIYKKNSASLYRVRLTNDFEGVEYAQFTSRSVAIAFHHQLLELSKKSRVCCSEANKGQAIEVASPSLDFASLEELDDAVGLNELELASFNLDDHDSKPLTFKEVASEIERLDAHKEALLYAEPEDLSDIDKYTFRSPNKFIGHVVGSKQPLAAKYFNELVQVRFRRHEQKKRARTPSVMYTKRSAAALRREGSSGTSSPTRSCA